MSFGDGCGGAHGDFSTWKLRQEDHYEFEGSLRYIVISRTT